MMNTPDILAAITPVIDVLEQLSVPYHIGGSVASSINGLPRLTIDVDLVADLKLEHVRPLVRYLETDYYALCEFLFARRARQPGQPGVTEAVPTVG